MSGVIWKTIPLHSQYEASVYGTIRHKYKRNILAEYENKTTKGTYKTVSIFEDSGKRRTQFVHRLVCLAFHGVPPEYPKIDTNHKDGDKHNNRPSNLEWSTRSANVKHAYASGLNRHCTRGRIIDTVTKEEHSFATAEDVGRFFKIPNNEGRDIIRHYQKKPYKGRYLIVIDEYQVPEFERNVGVYMVDFVNHKFTRTKTIAHMSYLTGYSGGAIAQRLNGETASLLNGCYFGSSSDPRVFEKLKDYTPEDVEESVRVYTLKGGTFKTKRTSGWKVKDYRTQVIHQVKTLKAVGLLVGVTRGTIESYVLRGHQHLLKGYVVKKAYDDTPFPEYSDALVQVSLKHQVSNGKPIKVTDLNSNTTEHYGNLSIFAKQIGEDPELFRQRWKQGTVTQYKIEYI